MDVDDERARESVGLVERQSLSFLSKFLGADASAAGGRKLKDTVIPIRLKHMRIESHLSLNSLGAELPGRILKKTHTLISVVQVGISRDVPETLKELSSREISKYGIRSGNTRCYNPSPLFQRDASSHERDGESKCRIGD